MRLVRIMNRSSQVQKMVGTHTMIKTMKGLNQLPFYIITRLSWKRDLGGSGQNKILNCFTRYLCNSHKMSDIIISPKHYSTLPNSFFIFFDIGY